MTNNINIGYYMKYAGCMRRIFAYIIDSIMFVVLSSMIFWAASSILLFSTKTDTAWDKNEIIINLITLFISIFYFAFLESSKLQATIGKLLLGIRVTDTDGVRISFSRALFRSTVIFLPIALFFTIIYCLDSLKIFNEFKFYLGLFGGILEIAFVMLFYIPIIFTKEKTSVSDMISKTRVVHKKSIKTEV